MGALLAIRYANFFTRALANLPADEAQNLSQQVANTLSKSFAGAVQVAREYSANKEEILGAAKNAFLHDIPLKKGVVRAMVEGRKMPSTEQHSAVSSSWCIEYCWCEC